jgi:hypothetical protein
MNPASPGVGLVLELIRSAAGRRSCASCGRSLAEATAAADDVDTERIVARLTCACGADELVEVRPAGEDGRAELR